VSDGSIWLLFPYMLRIFGNILMRARWRLSCGVVPELVSHLCLHMSNVWCHMFRIMYVSHVGGTFVDSDACIVIQSQANLPWIIWSHPIVDWLVNRVWKNGVTNVGREGFGVVRHSVMARMMSLVSVLLMYLEYLVIFVCNC
jgi:hypothetical protein